jgi:hypothetical protein
MSPTYRNRSVVRVPEIDRLARYPARVLSSRCRLGHDPVMTQRVYAHVHAAEMRSLGEAFGQAITRDQ